MRFVLLALLPIGAFILGMATARWRDRPPDLSKGDRNELKYLRWFEAGVLGLAHEHVAYNDPLAIKIIDLRAKQLGGEDETTPF